LNALASLTELGLFQKSSVLELSKTIVKLVVHPNTWVSNGAVGFLATSAKSIGPIDTQCLLYPIFRPYLLCDIDVASGQNVEQSLLDFKQKPVRQDFIRESDFRFLEWCMMLQSHGLRRRKEQTIGKHLKTNLMPMLLQVLFVETKMPVLQLYEAILPNLMLLINLLEPKSNHAPHNFKF